MSQAGQEPDPAGDARSNVADAQAGAAPAGPKPKGMTFVTVTAIVLGSLFGCCGVWGAGGLVANRAMGPAFMEMSKHAPGAVPDAQRDVFTRQAAFQERIFPFGLASSLLGALQSVALVVAGIMAHNRRASGARLLALLCLTGICVELIAVAFSASTMGEQSELSQAMMAASVPGPAGDLSPEQQRAHEVTKNMMAGMGTATVVIGWVMLLGMFLLKMSYYVFTALYLRRPDVTRYFAQGNAAG